jgi:hypothetical protein
LICNFASSNANYPYTAELNAYINVQFNQFTVVELEDYEPYILDFMTPSINIIGDFDGNGYQDICNILKAAKKGIYEDYD